MHPANCPTGIGSLYSSGLDSHGGHGCLPRRLSAVVCVTSLYHWRQNSLTRHTLDFDAKDLTLDMTATDKYPSTPSIKVSLSYLSGQGVVYCSSWSIYQEYEHWGTANTTRRGNKSTTPPRSVLRLVPAGVQVSYSCGNDMQYHTPNDIQANATVQAKGVNKSVKLQKHIFAT
jgi:hypothetical protein